MTYAYITEWMSSDDHAKFDRDLDASPVQQQQSETQALMAMFSMAAG